jgi:ABC-2 type transport system permease protein
VTTTPLVDSPVPPGPLAAEAAGPPPLGPRASVTAALHAVYVGQLARARVARVPLLFVAAFQSIGILLLVRGVVDTGSETTSEQVVAGASVLVIGFVALNLLAQRFGALRRSGGLDYYRALPAPPVAVVLGTAASYATFAVPGTIVTAVLGAVMYDLPLVHLWMLVPVMLLAGASLAGVGALLGLLAPKPEIATVAGQIGMSVVRVLGIIPGGRLPELIRPLRAVVPSTYAVDALAASFHHHVRWGGVGADLLVCVGVAAAALLISTRAMRRAGAR